MILYMSLLSAVGICTNIAYSEEITIDRFAGVGARAMGMGGAYIAVADDFPAIYWNPAGLAQMRRIEAYGTLYPYSKQKTKSVFYGSPKSDEISRAKLGSLGLVFPFPTYRGSLVFAAGFNRIKNFDAVFSVDGFSKYSQMHVTGTAKHEGELGAFSLAGAIDVSPSISLGLALHIWDGSNTYTQDLTLRDTEENLPDILSLIEYRTFSGEYDGVSVDFGVMVRGPKGLRFGGTIASPVSYTVDEEWEEEYIDQYEDGTHEEDTYEGSDDYRIDLPYQFGFGVSWTTFNVLVAAGVNYVDWAQSKYDNPPMEGMTNKRFQKQYKDALRFHLGCEVLIPFIPVKGRIGYYRDPVAFVGPREEDGPTIEIDNERDFLTLGVGVLIDQVLAVDAAWVSGFTKLIEGNTVEERNTSRLFLSAGYRF